MGISPDHPRLRPETSRGGREGVFLLKKQGTFSKAGRYLPRAGSFSKSFLGTLGVEGRRAALELIGRSEFLQLPNIADSLEKITAGLGSCSSACVRDALGNLDRLIAHLPASIGQAKKIKKEMKKLLLSQVEDDSLSELARLGIIEALLILERAFPSRRHLRAAWDSNEPAREMILKAAIAYPPVKEKLVVWTESQGLENPFSPTLRIGKKR